jgi:hypothetical protein
MLSRFMHITTCGVPHPFYHHRILNCTAVPNFTSIYHLLAITDKAAVNIAVLVFVGVCASISLQHMPRVEC